MNTEEAARKVGVTPRQMRLWQRQGWLTPKSNGRIDQRRRLEWSEGDVNQAKGLKNQESTKSASEAMIDSLGGQEFVGSLCRARSLQDGLQKGEVIIVGPSGYRVISRLSLIEAALVYSGTPAVILPPDCV